MALVTSKPLLTWALLVGTAFAVGPARAQQLGVAAFAERGPQHQAQGAYVSLSFDLDRRSPERALATSALEGSALEGSALEGSALAGSALAGSTFEGAPNPKEERTRDTVLAQLSTPSAPTSPAGPGLSRPPSPLPKPSDASVPAPAARLKRWSPAFLPRLLEATLQGRKQALAALEGVRERARIAGWLPVLTVRAGRNSDRSLRLTPTDTDPDRWQLTGGSDLRLEAQVTWDLDRLAFAPEEIAIERLRAQQLEAEQALTKRILDLVSRWVRSDVALQAADLLPEEQTHHWLERMAAELELDVLSHGWFSSHLHMAWQRAGN
jgi:Outer membrane efflux protein